MSLATYDPKLLVIALGGVPISGYADGTFITVERSADSFSEIVGASGETSRAKSRNRLGTVTLTLAQTSPSNDYLSALVAMDEQASTGVRPFIAKDSLGTSLFKSTTAYIKKPASAGYGKEIETREWTIVCPDLDTMVGGNPSL